MNQKENFIQAIREDEYAAWELSENVTIITDVEFDGTFLPSVHDRTGEMSEQGIDDLMIENDVHEVFEWDILEWSDTNYCWYPAVTGCEYEQIDESYWE